MSKLVGLGPREVIAELRAWSAEATSDEEEAVYYVMGAIRGSDQYSENFADASLKSSVTSFVRGCVFAKMGTGLPMTTQGWDRELKQAREAMLLHDSATQHYYDHLNDALRNIENYQIGRPVEVDTQEAAELAAKGQQ